VRPSVGFARILNWQTESSKWGKLRARAEEDPGKGTFWVHEMEQVMIAAFHEKEKIMSSTFRGRGQDTAGSIFRPALVRVDYVRSKRGISPYDFNLRFMKLLVSALVRARGKLGDVFNLLYVAGLVRWDILYPFLIQPWRDKKRIPSELEGTKEEQVELVAHSRSRVAVN